MLSTHLADLTILCKVVDNFGDIGFVYRLSKNLVQLNPFREIRIAVDNLAAFNKIESRVDPALAEQVLEVACADSLQDQEGADKAGKEGKPKTAAEIESESKPKSAGRLRIFVATNAAVCAREWTKKPARVILECFQCGRPDWLEEILFPTKNDGKTKTAEASGDSLQDQEGEDKAGNESKPKSAGRLRIFDATNAAVCAREWTKKPARVILECFQCGRPDWLEALLFDGVTRALIINIDYLTAEDYAEEFHRLKSGTRSPLVRKVNFMPGFTAKTGGLILDAAATNNCSQAKDCAGQVGIVGKTLTAGAAETASKPKNAPATENGFITKTAGPQILMFSYPKNFAPIIRAILRWNKAAQVNLAQGAGKESFLAANENCLQDQNAATQNEGKPKIAGVDEKCFKNKNAGGLFVRELPFLSQEEWDKNLYAQDILFVRGEDSLSRACLSGKPFVWQAYLQDDNYQLVKVRALLERMRPHFDAGDFAALESFWLLYNGADDDCGQGQDAGQDAGAAMEEACYGFLERSDKMKAGFEAFARSLFELGNFAEKLDEFVNSQEL